MSQVSRHRPKRGKRRTAEREVLLETTVRTPGVSRSSEIEEFEEVKEEKEEEKSEGRDDKYETEEKDVVETDVQESKDAKEEKKRWSNTKDTTQRLALFWTNSYYHLSFC